MSFLVSLCSRRYTVTSQILHIADEPHLPHPQVTRVHSVIPANKVSVAQAALEVLALCHTALALCHSLSSTDTHAPDLTTLHLQLSAFEPLRQMAVYVLSRRPASYTE